MRHIWSLDLEIKRLTPLIIGVLFWGNTSLVVWKDKINSKVIFFPPFGTLLLPLAR